MPFDQEGARVAFDKLSRHLEKLCRKPAPKSVHRFRTYSRRVEALLGELAPELSRSQKQVLKALTRLRKRAGRVRDLDAQIAALRTLKIPQEPDRKAQLMRSLLQQRARRERKLRRAFDKETADKLRRQLKRALKSTKAELSFDPAKRALQLFAQASSSHAPMTESRLHEFRTIGKRARYVAEMGGEDEDARRVADNLKHMQDAIGDWHDWLKLTQQARDLFGGVEESALVAALQNFTRAKFRHALDAVSRTQTALLPKPAAPEHGKRWAGQQVRVSAA